jgi:glutaminyl-peptide cyclotransferase
MKKLALAAVLVILAVLLTGAVWVAFLSFTRTPNDQSQTVQHYTYTITNTYPHDTNAFTEGLLFDRGVLYESTGGYDSSSLRRVGLENGSVLQDLALPGQYYGEGLALVNDSLVQLTWRENIGFVYDKATFGLLRNFTYATEGWGLTYDGHQLIMSDGTSKLYFLDPTTFQRVSSINVHDGNNTIGGINELEVVNGDVYANIWLTQTISIINPQTGAVKGYVDLSGIYRSSDPNAVLNGIAYDAATGRLFVTGKDWPSLYEIQILPTT